MPAQTTVAPAKLNLFLAVTGRRPDGFHDLVSLVAPLELGDALTFAAEDTGPSEPRFSIECDDPAVPTDAGNLVFRAAEAFAARTGWRGTGKFRLEKRIPMGAGLGGGSSDGVAALRLLNQLSGDRLDRRTMTDLAASIGSDCPLFLHDGPVVIRGRGERVEPLPGDTAARIRGRRVLVFKPEFGIPTPWVYGRLAAQAAEAAAGGRTNGNPVYLSGTDAERRLAEWLGDPTAPIERLLFNSLELPTFGKFLAIPSLLDRLRIDFGLQPRMTGSGSACFAFLSDGAPTDEITRAIRASWGESAYVVETKIA